MSRRWFRTKPAAVEYAKYLAELMQQTAYIHLDIRYFVDVYCHTPAWTGTSVLYMKGRHYVHERT